MTITTDLLGKLRISQLAFGLDACAAIIDALFRIVRTLFAMLKRAFLQPLYIPFVTPFLKEVCNVEITILDAAVYIAAIQVTLLCMTISGKEPFTDNEALGGRRLWMW